MNVCMGRASSLASLSFSLSSLPSGGSLWGPPIWPPSLPGQAKRKRERQRSRQTRPSQAGGRVPEASFSSETGRHRQWEKQGWLTPV